MIASLLACSPPASVVEHRGATLAEWSPAAYDEADPALDSLVDEGFDTVWVLVTWYVDGAGDLPHAEPALTPTDESVVRVLRAAADRGLRTGLKVHVDPLDGSWRGDLVPVDRAGWMARYGDEMESVAELAELEGVSDLVVGTELERLVDAPEWPRVVGRVRGAFGGRVLYAANWDGYTEVPFWDELDAVGVDAYYPVSSWPSSRRELERFARGRPVWLTELGYQSRRGACGTPWWTDGSDDGAVQARCFEDAFDQIARAEAIEGVVLWHAAVSDPPDDFDWTGKAAEDVVRSWLAR